MKHVVQILLCITLPTYASFDFEVQRKLNCHDEYRAKSGDILSVFYESFSKDGTKFNSTDNSPALQITLGTDRLLSGWEDNLVGRCAGEQVAAVVDKQLFFIMDIAVITRVLAPAPPTSRHFGILAGVSDKCDPASTIRPGTRVTMSTVATLPDLTYLKYSDRFPASNTPTKISEPGSLGVRVDDSEDEEATLGAGELVTGWELGLAGACEGERRRIMMNHDMAYGEAGAFRLIPPRAALVLDVTIVKVNNKLSSAAARRPRNIRK